MMKLDRAVIFAVVAVALLSAAVPMSVVATAPKYEEVVQVIEPFESINIYVYFGERDLKNNLPADGTPLKGSGSSLSSVIESAFEASEDYEVEMLSTGVDDTMIADGEAYEFTLTTGW